MVLGSEQNYMRTSYMYPLPEPFVVHWQIDTEVHKPMSLPEGKAFESHWPVSAPRCFPVLVSKQSFSTVG